MVSFSIDNEIIVQFKSIAKENALNMSQYIENIIKTYIENNLNKCVKK